MFEIIGKFTVFFLITFTLFIQYSLMCAGVVRKDISKFQNFMGWVPFAPLIIVFFITFFFIMKNMVYSFKKWFEINLGWFFMNGRKQDQWVEYLKNKYGNDK
jgi:hypothetical protein